MLHDTLLYYSTLCSAIPYHTIQYYTILYNDILYYTVLYQNPVNRILVSQDFPLNAHRCCRETQSVGLKGWSVGPCKSGAYKSLKMRTEKTSILQNVATCPTPTCVIGRTSQKTQNPLTIVVKPPGRDSLNHLRTPKVLR